MSSQQHNYDVETNLRNLKIMRGRNFKILLSSIFATGIFLAILLAKGFGWLEGI